jgi:hypothetical protein
MSRGKPAKKMGRPLRDSSVLQGDIMVTAVCDRYAIGRLNADRETQESLGCQPNRAAALENAFATAGSTHRVFLCAQGQQLIYLRLDSAEVPK